MFEVSTSVKGIDILVASYAPLLPVITNTVIKMGLQNT
jgi:hypothetical protein